jgi:hypothetical protein
MDMRFADWNLAFRSSVGSILNLRNRLRGTVVSCWPHTLYVFVPTLIKLLFYRIVNMFACRKSMIKFILCFGFDRFLPSAERPFGTVAFL